MKVTYAKIKDKSGSFDLDFKDPNFAEVCKEKIKSEMMLNYVPIHYEGFKLTVCMWGFAAKVADLLAVHDALTEVPQLVVEKFIRANSLASMRNFKSSYVGKFMTTSEVDCLAYFTKVMPLVLADDFYSLHVFDQYRIYKTTPVT
jgi:hypothetical protein